MSNASERRAVLVGGGSFSESPLKALAEQRRQQRKKSASSAPSVQRESGNDIASPTPKRSQAYMEKRARVQKLMEQGHTLPSSKDVMIATGSKAPTMNIGGKIRNDPTFGFAQGHSSFENGSTNFTNTVFSPSSKAWQRTKYGSHKEFQEASKAVQMEEASNGHALFRSDSSGAGHLGKHDPVLTESQLRERVDSGTMLGINSGATTSQSSKFTSYAAYNRSVASAFASANSLTGADKPQIGNFKGSASLKLTQPMGADIGVSVKKGVPGTTPIQSTRVTLNASESQTQVRKKLDKGQAKTVSWSVAQHFPTK